MLEQLQKTEPPTNGKMDGTWSQSAGNLVSWLAGFIDGEGCIGFDKISSKKNYHSPHVTITNCHEPTIERIVNILSGLGVRCWVKSPPHKENHKQHYVVIVRGMKRLKPLLELVTPHLFTKRKQAEQVLIFIKERLSKSPKAPYGPIENRIILLLHNLNHRGSSETTRTPLDREMI